jgi:hypothetical protein
MQPVEPLLISWLTTKYPSVVASVEDPEDLDTLVTSNTYFARVLRTGGGSGFTLDEPRVDIEVYALTKLAAATLAGQIRDSLMYTLQTYTVGTTSFGRPKVDVEPMWRPYDDINVFCYGATYQLYVHNS